MSEGNYQESLHELESQESLHEWKSQEHLVSIQAEPEWTDIQASKAWLEKRYPLLEDASLGSPLFRYMSACLEDGEHVRGSAPTTLSSMLSFDEAWRFFGETGLHNTHDPGLR